MNSRAPIQGRRVALSVAAVEVYSAPAARGQRLIDVSLTPPPGAGGFYRATALVEVRLSGYRGDTVRTMPVSCIQGSTVMESGSNGGFSLPVPAGSGVTVSARWVYSVGPVAFSAPELGVQLLDSDQTAAPLGPVAGCPIALPVHVGAGSGPWLDLGCLPYGLSMLTISATPNEAFFRAVTASESHSVPMTLSSGGRLLQFSPFPGYLFLQGRQVAASATTAFLAVAWS